MSERKNYLLVSCRRKSGIIYSYWMGAIENSFTNITSSEMKNFVKFLWDDEYTELNKIEIKYPELLCDFLEGYGTPSVKPCTLADYKENIKQSYNRVGGEHDVLCFMYDEASKIIYRGWVNGSQFLSNQNIPQF